MRLLLHIGTRKTGTTTLQRLCARMKEELAEHGIAYPTEALVQPRDDFNVLGKAFDRSTDEARDHWRRVLDGLGSGTTLISGETLSTLRDDHVASIREWTSGIEVRVLVSFRNIHDYLLSAYTQQVKSGTFDRSFRAYVEAPRVLPTVDYDAILTRWEEAFGADAVETRIYERVARDPGIVADFFEFLGVSDLVPRDEPRRANTAPSDRTIRLVKNINRVKRRLVGRGYRSRVFRLIRESALRRGIAWRFLELLHAKSLVEDGDLDAVDRLVTGLASSRLLRRHTPEEVDSLRRRRRNAR